MKKSKLTVYFLSAVLLTVLLPAGWVHAGNAAVQNEALRQVRLEQKPGDYIPLDVKVQNEAGETVEIGQYFGDKPIIMTPVYYGCPMLCGLVLNGLLKTLHAMSFEPGDEFDIVTFSISPEENPELAKKKKAEYIKRYGDEAAADGWHFLTLTGNKSGIDQLTDAVGYHYAKDPETGEYAHPAAIVILTPEGKISRYFSGIEFPGRDIKFSLMEAARNRIGSITDQLLLTCYHYNPESGRYGLAITVVLRIAGIALVIAITAFIALSLAAERKKGGKV